MGGEAHDHSDNSQAIRVQEKVHWELEMAQQLRVHATLAEELNSVLTPILDGSQSSVTVATRQSESLASASTCAQLYMPIHIISNYIKKCKSSSLQLNKI